MRIVSFVQNQGSSYPQFCFRSPKWRPLTDWSLELLVEGVLAAHKERLDVVGFERSVKEFVMPGTAFVLVLEVRRIVNAIL